MKKKRKGMKKLLLALLMALLVCGMMPTSAFAASAKTPSKVKLVSISAPAYNKIKITWKKASNATGYRVYYKVPGGKWKAIKNCSASTTSYTHTSSSKYPIKCGQKYTYTVKAYNSASKKWGSYDTKGLTTKTVPSTVKLKSATLNSSKNAVKVSWSKAYGGNTYRIYRKTTSAPKWKLITSVKSGTLSYTDKNPVKGETNTYTVRYYNSSTKVAGKYDSKGVSVKVPKPTPTPTPEQPKEIPVQSISVTTETGALGETHMLSEGSFKINARPNPANATESLTWTSTNPAVATVDSNGVVTMHAAGIATINITAKNCSAYYKVIVADYEAWAKEVVELTNAERIKNGCAPLQLDTRLQEYAMVRAKEISTYFSHYRPDGTVNHAYGENIAAGANGFTPEQVVQGWMNSDGHRAAILTKSYTHIGVGVYITETGRTLFVQNFATFDPQQNTTITLDANGGYCDTDSITVPYKSTIYQTDLPIPVREGYVFKGWTFRNGGFTSIGANNKNMTFVAAWEPA